MSLELCRTESQFSFTPTQPMDTAADSASSSGMFWEITGLRQIVIDYLDPKTCEAAAQFFSPKEGLEIFKKALQALTYAEKDDVDFIQARFYSAKEPPSLLSLITTHLPALRIFNFTTFSVPAKVVLQLSRDPRTALILAHSIAYLAAVDNENVRDILAHKTLSTLVHADQEEYKEGIQKIMALKERLTQGESKFCGKRKREEKAIVLRRSTSDGHFSKRSRKTRSPSRSLSISSQ
ncbi:MAG: hypothetical protein ACHQT8_04145 [Chlamydiales bacterium]